jgi:DNA-binding beta-propeller fold protein YncE
VFDTRARALRVIFGVHGASLIGDEVDFGTGITNAWVAPKLDVALTVTAEGVARLFRLDAGKATERLVEGLVVPDRAVFSPSGTALALVTKGNARIIKGLPDAPVVAGTVELPQGGGVATRADAGGNPPRSDVGAMAVSDDGSYLLYGSSGAVELLGISGDSRKLTDAGLGALVAFAPGGHDAAVVDGGMVAFFQDAAGAATVRRLPGIAGGKGVAFSPDGGRLFVAAASVTAVDVLTGDRGEIVCGCRPSGLVRIGNAFRLNDLDAEPLWLLDVSADPQMVFVPARAGI